MNKREQTKAEIRFYKRFLDELETTMNVKTTCAALKKVAARYGIPEYVIEDFILDRKIEVVDADLITKVLILTVSDDLVCQFIFSDEPDYKWADSIRRSIQNRIAHIQYYESLEKQEILEELEAEDENLLRRCRYCDFPMVGKRKDAIYCCDTCRKYAFKAKKQRAIFHNHLVVKKAETKKCWLKRALEFCFGK
ncbi:hypothetical protein BH11BAC7_BH11BAC7_21430 [soil metagenome]